MAYLLKVFAFSYQDIKMQATFLRSIHPSSDIPALAALINTTHDEKQQTPCLPGPVYHYKQ